MEELNKRGSVRRVLLSEQNATELNKVIKKLRNESCKVDASKAVNKIVRMFLNKYLEKNYEEFSSYFFDKKSHLKNLIRMSKNNDDLDQLIKEYVNKAPGGKKRGRKPKSEVIKDDLDKIERID